MEVELYRSALAIPAVAPKHKGCHCTIIPPHIQERLKEHPDREVQSKAHEHAPLTNRIRERRARGILSAPKVNDRPAAIKVYTALNLEMLPGVRIPMVEWVSQTDVYVKEAYESTVAVYNYFKSIHGLNSFDGRGMDIKATVHYGKQYCNAFWNGEQFAMGDGDGKVMDRFTGSLSVVGHEAMHAVIQLRFGDLNYDRQSGALNESIADSFGVTIEQESKKQTSREASWLVGDEVLIEGALRSMKNPGHGYRNHPTLGDDPQPAHMADYIVMSDDDGGVHINSGIPNKAFYEASVAADGNTWETTAPVWFKSLSFIKPTIQFEEFARITVRVVEEDTAYGPGSSMATAVRGAWEAVGIHLR